LIWTRAAFDADVGDLSPNAVVRAEFGADAGMRDIIDCGLESDDEGLVDFTSCAFGSNTDTPTLS
jgi:hypothetical protein